MGGGAADRARSAAAAGRRRPAPRSRALPSASRCRSRPRSGARICSIPLHPCYAGDLGIGPNPKLLARVKGADLDPAGRRPARRDAVAELHAARHSGAAPDPGARASRRRGARPRLPAASCRSTPRRPPLPPRSKACSRRTRCAGASETPAAHADFLAWTEKPTAVPGAVNLGEIIAGCATSFPPMRSSATAPAISRSGCIAIYRYRRYGTQLAPTSGSMGYGVPAAIAHEAAGARAHRGRVLPATATS